LNSAHGLVWDKTLLNIGSEICITHASLVAPPLQLTCGHCIVVPLVDAPPSGALQHGSFKFDRELWRSISKLARK
jgi:hypothetical protein